MKKLHISIFFSAADKYLSLLIMLAMTAIVARMLSPKEIGVFILANSVIVLAETVRDFGTSTYIVQKRDHDREGVRTAFTVMLIISIGLVLALVGASPFLARFYDEPRLVPAIGLAAMGIILGSLVAPSLALLRREMDFGALAAINLSGLLVNLLTVICAILLGWSYLSPIAGALTGSLYVAVAAMIHRPNFWIFRPCLSNWREVLAFGGYSSATTVLNNFYGMLPQLMLGRLAGLEAAAIYSRATILCQLPDRAVIGAIQPVILPAFARRVRSGGALREPYLRALCLLSAVHWPVLLTLSAMAEPVVRIVLGPQWDEAAPLIRIMAIAWLFMAPASLTFPVLVAMGRVSVTLTTSVMTLLPSAAILLAAAMHGMTAMAASMFLTLPLQVGVALAFIRRYAGFTWADIAKAVAKSLVPALLAAAIPLLCAINEGFRPDPTLISLGISLAGCVGGYVFGLVLTRHPLLGEVHAALSQLRRAMRRSAIRQASA